MESRDWARGDGGVMVKPSVADPDTGSDISGWQRRIIAIFDDEAVKLAIQWDRLTLKRMPAALIAWCEEQGVSCSKMNLSAKDVVPIATRDTEDDVAATIAELESQYSWLSFGGEQGKRIQQIVHRAKSHDEYTMFRTWHAYLEEHLVVPLAATVAEYQCGPIRQGGSAHRSGDHLPGRDLWHHRCRVAHTGGL